MLTGKQLADDTAKSVGQFVDFINYALLAFAFVALFVGSFIIVNTFSIILAQRSRELALLRCVGASRRQVLGSVLAEAAHRRPLASAVGLGVGVLVAIGLKAAFAAVGADLPSTSLVIAAPHDHRRVWPSGSLSRCSRRCCRRSRPPECRRSPRCSRRRRPCPG